MKRTQNTSLLLASCFLAPTLCIAQASACADPKAPRFAVVTTLKAEAGDSVVVKRNLEVQNKMRKAIEAKLGNICVLHGLDLLSDPANFPQLKGSMVFSIDSSVSFKNHSVAAISIAISAAQGAYVEQDLPLGVVTILIEDGKDYDIAAEGVMRHWSGMTKAMTHSGGN